ncbi:MAG TPA: GNAT family N-acetyltransferase, partial [Candidatus Paceibacterota bacterium]|nr:GNAT family N-acetyltransferase [Candidatus Paceibacterota bacterium]
LDTTANPRLYGLIAEIDAKPVGSTLYYFGYNTNTTRWVLHAQDVFVDEAYRGQGIGEALFKQLARIALARECSWIELEVFDWNEGAQNFYKRLGMTLEESMQKMYLESEALNKLALS